MMIRWLQRALDDAADSAAHIAAPDRRAAAAAWREGLIDVAERIACYPQSGRMVPEVSMHAMREVIYSNFRVIYLLAVPVIVAVRHCRRRLRKSDLRKWAREAQEIR